MALPADARCVKVRRLEREKQTVAQLVAIFCLAKHTSGQALCPECEELLDYAARRLDRCPFGSEKPACAKCPVHCYKPAFRERIREVMRFAGPRMILRHPASAVGHLIDKIKSSPAQS